MPEETTPPEGTPSTPEVPSIDWEKRARDQQAGFTRSQQELAAERAVWEDQQALLDRIRQTHPQLIAEEEPEFEPGLDPAVYELRQQNQALLAWQQEVEAERQQTAQAQQNAASMALFDNNNAEWAQEAGVELSESDSAAILGRLLKSHDPNDMDVHRQAFDAQVEFKKAEMEAQQAAWEEARKRPRVPTPPSGGQAATGAPNWGEMSEAQINEYMAERAAGRI